MNACRLLIFAPCVGMAACHTDGAELPAVTIRGEFINYATNVEICPGTVGESERWVLALAGRLGVSEGEMLPITYYYVDRDTARMHCAGAEGCTERVDDEIQIIAANPFSKHEFVHAVHLSAWSRQQPLMQEGLATLFDDDLPQRFSFDGSSTELSALLEVHDPRDDESVYFDGAYLMFWIVQRHGAGSLGELWSLMDVSTSPTAFLADFEQAYGESLETVLDDAGGTDVCQLVTCVGVGEPLADGFWEASLASGCDDDRVVGLADQVYIKQHVVEISEFGTYELAVSSGQASIAACGTICSVGFGEFATADAIAGSSHELILDEGLYRVETRSAGEPGFVRIKTN